MSKSAKLKKIKKTLTQSQLGGGNINSMFEEMIGLKDAEKDVIVPKLVEIRNLIYRLHQLFTQFATFRILRTSFKYTIKSMDQILKFANEMKDNLDIKGIETVDMYDKFSKSNFNKLYKLLKENPYVKALIVNCSNMKQWKRHFEDSNNLSDAFIKREPGYVLNIFDFSDLNLKTLWMDPAIKEPLKKYILNIIHFVWVDMYKIYDIVLSPDVNIEEFTKIIIDSIDKLQKHPNLCRCDMAFARIKKSVELLKTNFSTYYRRSVASENPNVILEGFISDVSTQGGPNLVLTHQFGKIIRYLKTANQKTGQADNPQIKQLFKQLNQNFEIMEKSTTSNAKKKTKDADKKSDVLIVDMKNDNDKEQVDNTNETAGGVSDNMPDDESFSLYSPAAHSIVRKRAKPKKKKRY